MIGDPSPLSGGAPPPRPRASRIRPFNGVKFGDHATMRGYYVGLVVDVSADGEAVMCAARDENGTMREFPFSSYKLSPARPRR